MSAEMLVVDRFRQEIPNRGTYDVVRVKAGRMHTERVVPPAGEEHAFTLEVWPTTLDVYVSPTGRSVRVFLNGKEVKA